MDILSALGANTLRAVKITYVSVRLQNYATEIVENGGLHKKVLMVLRGILDDAYTSQDLYQLILSQIPCGGNAPVTLKQLEYVLDRVLIPDTPIRRAIGEAVEMDRLMIPTHRYKLMAEQLIDEIEMAMVMCK